MTPVEASAVWRRVFRAMGEWETDDGHGSARPVFNFAWGQALVGVPLEAAATPRDREACWKAWLEGGSEKARKPRSDLEALAQREPGEEG